MYSVGWVGVGAFQSDQKQSALVQSASVPTFTHKRQGTRVRRSAQTYTHTQTHLDTCRIHAPAHTSHTFHTYTHQPACPSVRPPSLQPPCTTPQPLAESRSPQHLHHGWDHSGKQEAEVSALWCSAGTGLVIQGFKMLYLLFFDLESFEEV